MPKLLVRVAKTSFLNMKLIFLVFFFVSCFSNYDFDKTKKRVKKYDVFEKNEEEYIKENRITQIEEFSYGLDVYGRVRWKRIQSIKTYDLNGNLITEVRPQYEQQHAPEPPKGLSVEEVWRHSLQMTTTDIPTGYDLEIKYFYDTNGNLTRKEEVPFVYTFQYDKFNNCILACSKNNEMICITSRYVYSENGQIISRIDSTGAFSRKRVGDRFLDNAGTVEKYDYIYDDKGRIIFDGENFRGFNNKDQLVKVKIFNSSEDYQRNKLPWLIYEFSYLEDGKLNSETLWTNIESYTEAEKINTYYFYDERGLLKQKKEINDNGVLVAMYDFQYTFY